MASKPVNKSIDYSISLRETNIFKGVAICGMLMWHVFYCSNQFGIEFTPFVRFAGAIGDFCVSAFLLVSGYGLTILFESDQRKNGLSFVIHRLLKLYSNFWFVFFLVVLFGTFVMKMPINSDGSILHQLKQYLLEILAIRGQASYNDSWWFYSLIVSLYLLFPILYWGLKKALIPTMVFVFMAQSLSFKVIFQELVLYMPIFTVGMLWAMNKEKVTSLLSKVPYSNVALSFLLLLIPILGLAFIFNKGNLWSRAICEYGCISVGLMIVILSFPRSEKNILTDTLQFLGRHSANIYIVHLLFSKYWFPSFFYSLPSPWLIFMVLLLSSLLFSIAVEWLKEKSGYNIISSKAIVWVDSFLMKIDDKLSPCFSR